MVRYLKANRIYVLYAICIAFVALLHVLVPSQDNVIYFLTGVLVGVGLILPRASPTRYLATSSGAAILVCVGALPILLVMLWIMSAKPEGGAGIFVLVAAIVAAAGVGLTVFLQRKRTSGLKPRAPIH